MKAKIKRKSGNKGSFAPSKKGLAEKVRKVAEPFQRVKEYPEFRPGDTVKVHVRIKEGEKERIQIYEGVVMRISRRGAQPSFNVRKISHGVGVERVFLMNSPKVARVERVTPGKVRRARMFYLRKLEGKAARVERDLDEAQAMAERARAEALAVSKGEEAAKKAQAAKKAEVKEGK